MLDFKPPIWQGDDSSQCCHFHLGRIPRSQLQLPGNALDISVTAFEINVLAGERSQCFKLWVGGQITFRPIIDRLAADEQIRLSVASRILRTSENCWREKPTVTPIWTWRGRLA